MTLTGVLVPIFVPLVVAWVVAQVPANENDADIESWDNGLASTDLHRVA